MSPPELCAVPDRTVKPYNDYFDIVFGIRLLMMGFVGMRSLRADHRRRGWEVVLPYFGWMFMVLYWLALVVL